MRKFLLLTPADPACAGAVHVGTAKAVVATAAGNFSDGVGIFGDNNTVRQPTLTENLNGADFMLGHDNTSTRSRIFFNDTGVSVDGDAIDIDQNHVFSNNTGIYFSGGSQRSVVFLNQAYLNDVGIRIDELSSGSNSVFVNGSYANFTWDMEDDNANCDSNLWFNKVFGTANQNCIH